MRRIALAGNPNAGKSTLFNQLTGLRQQVGNYPGVTVERKVGRLLGDEGVEIVDLPGTYSLNPRSLDEQIAYDVLAGHRVDEPAPDVVVCVVDATNLERNLYLACQIIDLGVPVVVVLNMMDEVEKAGLVLDVDGIREALGVPVVPMVAARGEGIEALRAALRTPPPPATPPWTLSEATAAPVRRLAERLGEHWPAASLQRRYGESLRVLTSDRILDGWKTKAPAFYEAVLETRSRLREQRIPYEHAEMMGRYSWLRPLVARVSSQATPPAPTLSDRIDAVLLHRVAGPILFLGIMLVIFQAIFSWATPAMDLIEAGIGGLGSAVRAVLPEVLLTDLVVDGIIAGVGNVLVFLPQILLLFFFLGLMENTGYMARTAFIMDRLMRRVGLSGGSVIPMISAFACAIPGIMAARTMDDQRDRLLTIMVVPLMSCSARLPVYALFIGAFISTATFVGPITYQGLAMFSLYLFGVLMAFLAAFVLSRIVEKREANFFVMELPPYRAPQWKLVFWRMVERARIFIRSAGRIIFLFSVLLWALATFPRVELPAALVAEGQALEAARAEAAGDPAAQAQLEEEAFELENAAAAYRLEQSFIGRFGHAIEPVMRPLGFDWKLSAGIIASFAAREVIISALGTIYSVGDADEASPALREQLRTDRDARTGELVYTPLVAVSLLVFFVLAMQCMSTLAVARRELNSWKWPIFMWVYMTGLAYLCALLVYQGGLALGFG